MDFLMVQVTSVDDRARAQNLLSSQRLRLMRNIYYLFKQWNRFFNLLIFLINFLMMIGDNNCRILSLWYWNCHDLKLLLLIMVTTNDLLWKETPECEWINLNLTLKHKCRSSKPFSKFVYDSIETDLDK